MEIIMPISYNYTLRVRPCVWLELRIYF
jgi:hypothetical protein